MIKKIIHFIKNQKHYLSSDRYIAFYDQKKLQSEKIVLLDSQEVHLSTLLAHILSQ